MDDAVLAKFQQKKASNKAGSYHEYKVNLLKVKL